MGYPGYFNANNKDLENDFPNVQFWNKGNSDVLSGHQNETTALINWLVSNPFVLSGYLQTGFDG